MLTLKAPIQLHIAQNLTGNAEAFGERIRGNYGLLGAHFAAKDLLFLMTAPPELPEDLGGMSRSPRLQHRRSQGDRRLPAECGLHCTHGRPHLQRQPGGRKAAGTML